MHVALARKYRPKLFAELVGQEHVARALRGAIEANRVAHGYLLTGPRGVGKTTAARILAMALNCEARHAGGSAAEAGEPCGRCVSCERIWAGSASLDVIEIDAASNRGVDDARDLRERAMYAASQEGRHKVYIVDEAHMLTREAWNTLLKVLEEPPPGVVFVFATTEPHKITNAAAPVMSRLQRFDFRRVGPQAIAARLTEVAGNEKVRIAPDAIELIARVANGGMRDALSVLDQAAAFGDGLIEAAKVRDLLGLVADESFAELLDIVAGHRAAEVFPFVARLVEGGVDLVAFAEGAGDLWRAALAVRLGAEPDGVSAALGERLREQALALAPGDLLRILKALTDAEEPIKRGGSPRLALETLIVRWTLMDRTVEIAELLGTGDRGPRTEDRGPRTEDRGPRTGDRGPRTEDRGPIPGSQASPAGRRSPVPGPSESGLDLPTVRRQWPAIIDAVRSDNKRMVAENLADTEPVAIDGSTIVLRHLGGNPMTPDTVERNRVLVEAAATRVLGSPVRLALEATGDRGPRTEDRVDPGLAVPGPQSPVPAKRLSPQAAKSERAKALRGKDPALDRAMDALDLELLE